MGNLSAHFSDREFRCPGDNCCSNSAPVDWELTSSLEQLREIAGAPLRINSGFRCRTHNRTIRNSRATSQHIRGKAADIALPRGITIEEFARMAEDVPGFREGGVGLYDRFMHVDVRGHRARWDNRT